MTCATASAWRARRAKGRYSGGAIPAAHRRRRFHQHVEEGQREPLRRASLHLGYGGPDVHERVLSRVAAKQQEARARGEAQRERIRGALLLHESVKH